MNEIMMGRGLALPVGVYPHIEPLVPFPRHDTDRMLLRPNSMAAFIAAMFYIDAKKARGLSAGHLVLPYVPGARQDRLNEEGDYLFTAKSVADMINARGFARVTVLDPHSDVITGLIDRCFTVSATLAVSMIAKQYDGIIAPDSGAIKRAGAVARMRGLPLYHAGKTRDISDGSIRAFWLQEIPTGHYLVVDDICDGGGTFIGLAEQIHNQASTADLYVSHGIFTQGTEALLTHYQSIYCTDSILGEKHGVTVLPICESTLIGA